MQLSSLPKPLERLAAVLIDPNLTGADFDAINSIKFN